jgi:hypothetical protein
LPSFLQKTPKVIYTIFIGTFANKWRKKEKKGGTQKLNSKI